MTTRELRSAAEALAQEGANRQQIYDQLRGPGSGLSDEQVARVVRYVPSLDTRARYRTPHAVLIILLWLSAVGKSLFGLGMALERGWNYLPMALLLPALSALLAISIARFRTRAYHTTAVLGALGLFRFIRRIDWSNFDPWDSIDLVVATGICGLSWFLFLKVASNYQVVKHGKTTTVIFPDEPTGSIA